MILLLIRHRVTVASVPRRGEMILDVAPDSLLGEVATPARMIWARALVDGSTRTDPSHQN